jgi:2-alkenal reductase
MNRRLSLVLAGLVLATLACTSTWESLSAIPTLESRLTPSVGAGTSPVPTLTTGAVAPALFSAGDLAALYGSASPGVVTILTYADLAPAHDAGLPIAQGTGFVIDSQGHIVTNQHVVQDAKEIEVDFPSGDKAWATLLGTDPDSDLAVLQVDVPAEGLTPLPLGDSGAVQVGETVAAIGNPFGLSGTMTVGIVSALGRTLDSERTAPGGQAFTAGGIIQTDAAINPGNSGGPLLNLRGEVIGVNRAIRTEVFTVSGDAANSGVGFAIPINIVKRVVPSLIARGSYDYPYIGISSLSSDRWNLKIVEELGIPHDAVGAYVTCVTPGGPAEAAGLQGAASCDDLGLKAGGDLVIAIDRQPIEDFNDLLSYLISNTEVGQVITVTVLRDGKEVELPLTIAARP